MEIGLKLLVLCIFMWTKFTIFAGQIGQMVDKYLDKVSKIVKNRLVKPL